MRRLVLVLVLALVLAPWRAFSDPTDTVALLPLDADQHLELYGHPVAAELARALTAEKIEVAVIGAKMAVPDRARLVVDGTIKAGQGGRVVLTARVRERATGTAVWKGSTEAEALTTIDRAATDLGKQLLAAVKAELEKKAAPPAEPPKDGIRPPLPAQPAAAAPRTIVVQIKGSVLGELGDAAGTWAKQHHREVAAAGAADVDATVVLEPLSYSVEPGQVPTARARVHVVITDRSKAKKFDRVVVTDTVVGDRGQPAAQLAPRVAREVLAIVEPHMRRAIEGWK